MKRTEFVNFDLSERVALYVPSTIETNKETDNEKQINRVFTEFCQMFGGATATEARGGWLSQSCGLVTEKITVIYSNCTKKARRANMARLLALAASIRDEMRQEAVTVEINNKIAFI